MKSLARPLIALLMMLPTCSALADGPGKYLLEALGGAEKLATVETGGKTINATEGMELHPGDRLKTGYRTSAKIVYPDGTKVIVGRLADVKIGEKSGDVQFSELNSGEMRAAVSKAGGGKKLKFMIRTKNVVMGVRGTDFLFRHDEHKEFSQLYTFDGRVELSRSEAELQAGKGVAVDMNYYADVTPTQIIGPKPFEPKPFIASIAKDDPELLKQARSEAAVFREDYAVPFRGGMRWLGFELSGIAVLDLSSSGGAYTGELAWNPEYLFSKRLSLRGDIGGFLLKGNSVTGVFPGLEGALLVGFNLNDSLGLYAGGGVEGWPGKSDLGAVLKADVAWKLHGWGWLDRVYGGVSDFLAAPSATPGGSDVSALQLNLGVGVLF